MSWEDAVKEFDREARSLAIQMLEAGKGTPKECLASAERLVANQRKLRDERLGPVSPRTKDLTDGVKVVSIKQGTGLNMRRA